MIDRESLARLWAPTLDRLRGAGPDEQPEQAQQVAADADFGSDAETWEESVGEATADTAGPQTGVMVALYPSAEQASELAVEGGEDAGELHVTLAFLGEVGAELSDGDQATLLAAVRGWATTQAPIQARTNGIGVFHNDPPVTYATVDSAQLPATRQSLVEALERAGLPASMTHGFIPHMTLAYDDRRDLVVPHMDFTFDGVVVAFAGTYTPVAFGGQHSDGQDPLDPATAADVSVTESPIFHEVAQSAGSMTVTGSGSNLTYTSFPYMHTYDRPAGSDVTVTPPTEQAADKWPFPESARAFVTTIDGRTLVSGPASAMVQSAADDSRMPDVASIADKHLLWMHGRFVGAEQANRNGAFWSAGDLEMGRASVVNGPLNWLHEARYVIGTLAKADYVNNTPTSVPGPERSSAALPHLTATAAIWRWIWPDEAYVVQQASDLGQLWYSMECISREVQCSGETGCGNTTSYGDYVAGAACDHVKQRASVRRFVDPVFLGGAVIVPPARPGWADADASVMHEATGLAEAAFEQANQPDISASNWEQMMAQLVLFARQ